MRRSNSASSLLETGRRRKSFTPARIASMRIVLSETSGPKPSGRKTAATVVSGETTAASSARCLQRTNVAPHFHQRNVRPAAAGRLDRLANVGGVMNHRVQFVQGRHRDFQLRAEPRIGTHYQDVDGDCHGVIGLGLRND